MNKKEIQLGNQKFLVIDLSEPLSEKTEVYPGDPKLEKEIFSDIKKTGWQHHIYKLGDHNFCPHFDAPKHQNPELQNKGMEIFNLDSAFSHAFLIDLSKAPKAKEIENIKYLIKVTKEDLKPFADLFSQKQAVLIRTGYDQWIEANKPHAPQNLPYLTKEAAEFIVSFKNIKVVGIDSLTVDPVGEHDAHRALKNTLIVESLVHLNKIPTEARENFDLQTSPIRIIGATGGPGVVYAFIGL